MPIQPCPACARAARRLDDSTKFASVNYYRCEGCGHVWTTSKEDGSVVKGMLRRCRSLPPKRASNLPTSLPRFPLRRLRALNWCHLVRVCASLGQHRAPLALLLPGLRRGSWVPPSGSQPCRAGLAGWPATLACCPRSRRGTSVGHAWASAATSCLRPRYLAAVFSFRRGVGW